MKKVTIGLTLGVLILLTACVGEQGNIAVPVKEKKKENSVREEATLDLSEMPIQTYEEYTQLKKFVLERYIKSQNARSSGIAYLNDGTKIKYYFGEKYIAETISHFKYPFQKLSKGYFRDTRAIEGYTYSLSNLNIKKDVTYNKVEKVIKVIDYDSKLKELGLDYKKILEWADDKGIIDLKTSQMLKGNRFFLQKASFEKNWKTNWSKEEKKHFQETNNLSDKVTKNLFSHSHYWNFSVDYPRYQDEYIFSADGSFIQYLGKTYKQ